MKTLTDQLEEMKGDAPEEHWKLTRAAKDFIARRDAGLTIRQAAEVHGVDAELLKIRVKQIDKRNSEIAMRRARRQE